MLDFSHGDNVGHPLPPKGGIGGMSVIAPSANGPVTVDMDKRRGTLSEPTVDIAEAVHSLWELRKSIRGVAVSREGRFTVAVYLPDGTRTEFCTVDRLARFIAEAFNMMEEIANTTVSYCEELVELRKKREELDEEDDRTTQLLSALGEIYIRTTDPKIKELIDTCLG